jgi:hypothetical protein
VADGPSLSTYMTDGIDTAVRQAEAVADENDRLINPGLS